MEKKKSNPEILLHQLPKVSDDHPITGEEIVSQNYLTQQQYDFIGNKCFELFEFGQRVADERGLIGLIPNMNSVFGVMILF